MARRKLNRNLPKPAPKPKLTKEEQKQKIRDEIQKNKKLLKMLEEEDKQKVAKHGMLHHLLGSVGVHPKNEKLKFLNKKKEFHEGHFSEFRPNSVCQADLMELPDDKGFKFLLVIVDNVSRAIDAEPMKLKSDSVEAMKKIFKRKYIKPNFDVLQCDTGGEFTSKAFQDLMHSKHIAIRYGRTNRHNQQAIVEHYNGIISKVLNTKMNIHELETNEQSLIWKKNVRPLILELNNKFKKKAPLISQFFGHWKMISNKASDSLLKVGDKVYVVLDQPTDILSHKKLSGHNGFRQGDLRYNPHKIHIIENILYVPNSYPRYIVSGLPNVSFTKAELLQ